MTDHNILEVLRAVDRGFVRHAHPFTWDCADGARHIDPRTLQRALQQNLIGVTTDPDRELHPVTLTPSGLERLGRPGSE